MRKIHKISILWGTDGFGKWLTEYIIREFPNQVEITVTGRNKDKWNTISKDLWVYFISDNIEAVKNADIVIYSVPISLTQTVIEATLPHIQSGAIVADVTSIKKFPSRCMEKRDDIIIIPTHPMFGPYISTIAWQVCVLTPNDRVKKLPEYLYLKDFLESRKAKVREETPENHDKMMAVVQWLTHLNMFVVWETMKRLDFDIWASMDFISPIYKLMISSVWRYLGQNPWLYADIQMYNDEVIQVHEKFLDTAKNFHNSVKDKDYDKFCSDVIDAREYLWIEHCKEWQEYTDKVIYLLWQQLVKLKETLWKQITLKNIYSAEELSGKLLDFNEKEIFLEWHNSYLIHNWEIV